MASTRRKSAAIALAVVGVAGLSLASAAQLNVNSASLGAGTDVVASCDTDGINVAFANAFDTGGYTATAVTLSGVAGACDNNAVRVTVADVDGESLGEVTGSITPGGTTTISGLAVDAADIENVYVVISG